MNRSLTSLVAAGLLVAVAGVQGSAEVVGSAGASDRQRSPAGDAASALMPRAETGASRFLAEHPEYDGRGVVVAIYDTGVDPGAPGLQVTTDGQPKIIDIIDGSGSGDVDTSTVRSVDDDGMLQGLSGRALRPGEHWTNPKGEYHLGVKPAYELFPGGLVRRMRTERRKDWDEQQRVALEAAQRALDAWDDAHAKPTREELKKRDDLKARIEQLDTMQESYRDPGAIFDCVVFHDGDVWRAVVDTDEDGDLGNEKLLASYRLEREHATFGNEDLLNFAVNVYDDGKLLSIVADSGAHGTHVAGIVAAHYPDQPELNGVAPGAQLVAVKIGDTRLGSSSVGTGEMRGHLAVLRNKCDLINMSYGGPTPFPNRGRINEIHREIVNEHGVIFVCSAGNAGPCLSTVGAPGGTTSDLIGVGAVISRDMMADQYAVREPYESLHYTWSSRGPTPDGDLGVVISAPGGAISPVPNWLLQKNMLMNGTSMASPNACGAIALLLSGMKQNDLPHTPHSVRRAIANTAVLVEGTDIFAQGQGMIQVDRAWDSLVQNASRSDHDVRYQVNVANRNGARGIYLREPHESDRPFASNVTVNPVFPEEVDNHRKVNLDTAIRLESTAAWVDVADSIRLMHGGRRFDVRVDPVGLEPGVHYAEVRGFDASDGSGPLFRLPVTVVRPISMTADDNWTWRETMSFAPGQIERRFFEVPAGATWADLTFRRLDADTSRRLVLQTLQLRDDRPYSNRYLNEYMTFENADEELRSIAVDGGHTVEVAVAQYWSSMGEGTFEVSVSFHGLSPSNQALFIDGGKAVVPVDVTAELRDEDLAPAGSLTALRRFIRPKSAEIHPLSAERDRLPRERQIYGMVLQYEFEIDDEATISFLPMLLDQPNAWENYESHILMVFDKNRQHVGTPTESRPTLKLKKGTYTARYHVRHDDEDTLEKLKSLPLRLDRKLGKAIKLKIAKSPGAAIGGGRGAAGRSLKQGDTAVMYIGVPDAKKMPKFAQPGDLLIGNITLGAKGATLVGSGQRPGGFPVAMTVVAKPEKEKPLKPSDDKPKDERTEQEKLAEDLRDLQVKRLESLATVEHAETFDAVSAEILDAWPDHLPVLLAQLSRAEKQSDESGTEPVLEAAQRVTDAIDEHELAAHFGVAVDEDDPDVCKQHDEMKKQRDALTAALLARANALLTDAKAAGSDEAREAFEEAYDALDAWADLDGDDYFDLRLERERLHGRTALALGMVNDRIDEKPLERSIQETRMQLLEELGWDHWTGYERRWMLRRYRDGFPPF